VARAAFSEGCDTDDAGAAFGTGSDDTATFVRVKYWLVFPTIITAVFWWERLSIVERLLTSGFTRSADVTRVIRRSHVWHAECENDVLQHDEIIAGI